LLCVLPQDAPWSSLQLVLYALVQPARGEGSEGGMRKGNVCAILDAISDAQRHPTSHGATEKGTK
jgi:hypothetical protein